MAITSAASQISYNQGASGVGRQNREDLSDTLYRLSPTDTPFLSGLERVTASAVLHEWIVEDLASAANNAQLEGDTGTSGLLGADNPTTRTRWNNYTQISRKIAEVSGTQESVKKAGMKSQMAREIVNKGLELKRDMEVAITQNGAFVQGNSTTARQTRGLEGWITNWQGGTGAGAAPVPSSNTAPVEGTNVAYSETRLKTMLQTCYTNGGNPTVLMMGATNKQLQSTFTNGATRFQDVAENKMVSGYDVYVSDFGRLKIIPNRFSRAECVFALDMDYWKLAELRKISTVDLAKIGDSERKMILCEYALEACNEKSSGQIRDTL
jgi:hypothetical protein